MLVGIPKEVKDNEYRVAATPEGVRELVARGTSCRGAGIGRARARRSPTMQFAAAGAEILADADAVFAAADMIVKVKEPQPQEYERFREGQVLFTYLHLAADERLTRFLAERRVTAVAYETVQSVDGRLPLLAPMSEIAGRMAPQEGATALERPKGGRGVLMGGASGVAPARVVVLGAGMAGANAAQIAAGMEADVTVVDRNVDRLREIDRIWHGRIQTVMSSSLAIERLVLEADLVVGAVLVPGARAPHLVSAETVARDAARRGARRHLDRPGRLLRDIARDDALRPDVRGRRRRALLRRQHAGRGAAHLHLRAHERDLAVRRGDRRPWARRGRAQ